MIRACYRWPKEGGKQTTTSTAPLLPPCASFFSVDVMNATTSATALFSLLPQQFLCAQRMRELKPRLSRRPLLRLWAPYRPVAVGGKDEESVPPPPVASSSTAGALSGTRLQLLVEKCFFVRLRPPPYPRDETAAAAPSKGRAEKGAADSSKRKGIPPPPSLDTRHHRRLFPYIARPSTTTPFSDVGGYRWQQFPNLPP